jgi:hypothetical protein
MNKAAAAAIVDNGRKAAFVLSSKLIMTEAHK